MAKKRKTREQKKLADSRHTFKHSASFILASSSSPKIEKQKNLALPTNQTNAYPFLKKDLSKTALLTLAILVFQILFFAILKNHILVIPGLNY